MSNPNSPETVDWKFPVIVTVIVILMWAGSGFLLYCNPERGTFGDMFGAINALFSGLAFAGVIYAILLQRKELSLQRHELELTRNELEGQKIQLENQNETLQIQNFENTFFQMLRLHHEIVNSIDKMEFRKGQQFIKKGRDAFVDFYNELKNNYSKALGTDEQSKINIAYVELFAKYQSDIGHYFRNLYHILKFVDRKGPDKDEDKLFYTNLIRAQLSSHELLILFYNCLVSQFGGEKFKPLIQKYYFLKNMPLGQIIQRDHEKLYRPSAFKKAPYEKNQ